MDDPKGPAPHIPRKVPLTKALWLRVPSPCGIKGCTRFDPRRAIAADGTSLHGRALKVTYSTPPGGAATGGTKAAAAPAPAAAAPAPAAAPAVQEPVSVVAAANAGKGKAGKADKPEAAIAAAAAPAAAVVAPAAAGTSAAAAPGGRVPGYNVVYVGNVDFEATAEDLTQLFTKAGARPSQVRMHTDRKGR